MKYAVILKPSVKKQLKRLDRKQAERILAKVYALAEDPFPNASDSLSNQAAYRLRVGDYRVIYEVQKQEVRIWVIRIQHRREVYKNLS